MIIFYVYFVQFVQNEILLDQFSFSYEFWSHDNEILKGYWC
jgi:hypothetical protein